jgi:hypothetical protein
MRLPRFKHRMLWAEKGSPFDRHPQDTGMIGAYIRALFFASRRIRFSAR